MPYVSVSIDLDEIRTSDLIEELQTRYLDTDDKTTVLKLLEFEDAGKHALFLSVMDRYSLLELEELFSKKKEPAPVPKEQLSLELK